MASNLVPVEVRPGISIVTVTGSLLAKDNKFKLQLLTKSQIHELSDESPTHTLPPLHYTWGSIDLQLFMSLLSKAGIYDAVVDQNPNGCVVHIVSLISLFTIFMKHYFQSIYIDINMIEIIKHLY